MELKWTNNAEKIVAKETLSDASHKTKIFQRKMQTLPRKWKSRILFHVAETLNCTAYLHADDCVLHQKRNNIDNSDGMVGTQKSHNEMKMKGGKDFLSIENKISIKSGDSAANINVHNIYKCVCVCSRHLGKAY